MMKKMLLSGIAALFLATGTAHADTLPKEMLGHWCQNSTDTKDFRRVYDRKNCHDSDGRLLVKPNDFEEWESGCDFKNITRLPNNSYFIRAECSGNEDMILQIIDNQLMIVDTTIRFCVAVIEPPENVTTDPEFDPKSWLGLREKPDTKSRVTFRLGDKEYLEADEVKGDWTHISKVNRLSESRVIQGWVRSKYVQKMNCDDRYKTSEDINPGDQPKEADVSDGPLSPAIPGFGPPFVPTIGNPEPNCYPKWTGLKRC
jgi:hypothetical protein